jgi:hypothetical protein
MLIRNEIARAQKLFDQGHVERAAWLLADQRRRALAANQTARLQEIEQALSVLRERLQHDERLANFDATFANYKRPGLAGMLPADAPAEVTPLSFGIVLTGAAVMVISVFLPQFEANTLAQIEKNSLIQNGDGWWFIVLALVAAGAAYRAYRNQIRTYGTMIPGGIGILVAIYYGTSHSQRELCSVSSVTFGQHCTVATPGIGIYAAGVGGLLIVIGGWQIFQSDLKVGDEEDQGVTVHSAEAAPTSTIAERLRTLDQLHSDKLITDGEHERRRAALLDEV